MHAAARQHAVVVGGGIAGLLAARVLGERFEQVTIVERDRLPQAPGPRAGAPQAQHVHGLLASGRLIVEALLPGLDAELAAAGAPLLDWTDDCRWYTSGGWKPRFRSGILSRPCSRDLLEWAVRRRVVASPRVSMLEQYEAVGLLPSADAGRIAGVLLRPRTATAAAPDEPAAEPRAERAADPGARAGAAGERAVELAADLVVDASGRGSRAPDWLAALGYRRPAETTINAFLGYASRWYQPAADPSRDWHMLGLLASPPQGTRGGIVQPIEGGRWIVTLAGAARDYPPTDEAAFLAFARSLPGPELYEAIRQATPLGPIRAFRRTANRLRHFERLRTPPAGFVALGDAVCSLNPVYGQGMTVAALSALALGRWLRRPRPTSRQFQRRLRRTVAPVWLLATGEDFRHPTTEGGRPDLPTRLMHRYIDRLQLVATHSPAAHRALIEVLNLLRPPLSLLDPRLLVACARG